MPFEAYRRQLRIGHGDTGRVLSTIEFGPDVQAGLAVRGPDEADDGCEVDQGVPRQFMAMWENKRCSILFHLLVPGGK